MIFECFGGDFLEFRQLETFVHIVKLQSFSKAAQKLYLTQPTVTSHIQSLEEELGTLILNRFGKKATPTEAGEILYKYALDLVNMRNMAQFDLSAYNGKIQGKLSVSASSIPRNYLLPKLLAGFMKKYPDISFEILERDSKSVMTDIKEGETDFGLIGAKYEDNYIDYINIFEDVLCLITPNTEDFPWENGSFVDKEIIFDHRLLLREDGSGTRRLIETELLGEELSKEDSLLKNVSYIEDSEAIKRFVESGVGISITSDTSVKREVEQGSLKMFYIKDANLNRNFYFAYHKKRELSPLNKKFKEFVLDEGTIEKLRSLNR